MGLVCIGCDPPFCRKRKVDIDVLVHAVYFAIYIPRVMYDQSLYYPLCLFLFCFRVLLFPLLCLPFYNGYSIELI